MAALKIPHDYYAVLGITHTGDEDLIRTSYMRLAKLRHPDKNLGNPNATAEFQLVCP
jgi:curved DNA-binding protein CbpA